MEPLISLVIPVYNVEPFLRKCVESALAQTYPNYEVILVDDGSTDNSGKICDEYAAKDERIRVFHKPNGGLSSARNFGVERAIGEYISLVDSDDYISSDYLEYLYYLLKEYDADLSCSAAATVYGSVIIENSGKEPDVVVLDAAEAIKRICYTSIGADTKLYKKDLLLKHPFPVNRLYEDLATIYKIYGDCPRVVFSDKILYYWVQRNGSILHSAIDEKQYDIFWAAKGLLEYVRKNYPEAEMAAKVRCATAAIGFSYRSFVSDDKNRRTHFRQARDFIKPYIFGPMFDRRAGANIRITCFAMWMGYLPSYLLWLIKSKIKQMLGRTVVA